MAREERRLDPALAPAITAAWIVDNDRWAPSRVPIEIVA